MVNAASRGEGGVGTEEIESEESVEELVKPVKSLALTRSRQDFGEGGEDRQENEK